MSETTPFKVGDVVQLNSGGMTMTVQAIVDEQNVRVFWFDMKHELQVFEMNVAMLRRIATGYTLTPLAADSCFTIVEPKR